MPDPVTWPREDHTAAKHQLLRAFFLKWVSIHSSYFASRGGGLVRIYDGFAGPGVYDDDEDGSPVLMVRALCDHEMLATRWGSNEYSFEFVELDPRRVERLATQLAKLRTDMESRGLWAANITISVRCGAYQDHVPKRIGRRHEALFLFLDPFGFAQSPMSLTSALLSGIPKCDLLVFLPLGQINRFLAVDDTEAANDAFFGDPAWRDLIDAQDRPRALLCLFETQLRARVEWVQSFRLLPSHRHGTYFLVGASDAPAGFDTIKDAFWNADPVNGQSYEAPKSQLFGQDSFDLQEPPGEPNTRPLLASLYERFGTEWFTVEEAIKFTDEKTRFRSKAHLKLKTLKPADGGVLEVERPAGIKRGTFTEGKRIKMRFKETVRP